MSGPAIDAEAFARLSEITGDDPVFLAELIDTYLDDGATQVAALREAVASGESASLTRPAHTLKSSSASIGALSLAELCRSLEADSRAGIVGDAAARVDAIAAAFESVGRELQAGRSR